MDTIDFIVVESGGTKSSWWFGNKQSGLVYKFSGPGLHPASLTLDKSSHLKQKLAELGDLQMIPCYFYGAGCESPQFVEKIRIFLEQLTLRLLHFKSDLTGACIALLGTNHGYAGIIGTGAIVAEYNGKEVIRTSSGLGYILGDEGSGFDIGKRILNTYFRDELSTTITAILEEYFGGKSNIIPEVYSVNGRQKTAGIASLIHPYRKDKRMIQIINEAFESFYHTAIAPHTSLRTISLIGSIAYFYREELEQTLTSHGIRIEALETEAIRALFNYHFKLIQLEQ